MIHVLLPMNTCIHARETENNNETCTWYYSDTHSSVLIDDYIKSDAVKISKYWIRLMITRRWLNWCNEKCTWDDWKWLEKWYEKKTMTMNDGGRPYIYTLTYYCGTWSFLKRSFQKENVRNNNSYRSEGIPSSLSCLLLSPRIQWILEASHYEDRTSNDPTIFRIEIVDAGQKGISLSKPH